MHTKIRPKDVPGTLLNVVSVCSVVVLIVVHRIPQSSFWFAMTIWWQLATSVLSPLMCVITLLSVLD